MQADDLQHRPRLPARWRCEARVDHNNHRSRCFKFRSHVRAEKEKRRRHEAYGYFPGTGGTVQWTDAA